MTLQAAIPQAGTTTTSMKEIRGGAEETNTHRNASCGSGAPNKTTTGTGGERYWKIILVGERKKQRKYQGTSRSGKTNEMGKEEQKSCGSTQLPHTVEKIEKLRHTVGRLEN